MQLRSLVISSLLTLPLVSQGQVFSHDFTADATGPEPAPFFNLNNASTASSFGVVNGQGLNLTLTTSSKVIEEFATFTTTPVTLASIGDSITLTATFSSSGIAANTGGLLAGLYNSAGTPATKDLSSSTVGTATADDNGYFGIMGYSTSAGTSTKFYSRTGTITGDGELGYYSAMTAGTYTQLSSTPVANNANLLNNTLYTLNLSITKGAAGNTIVAKILDPSQTAVDSWTTTDAAGTYNTFDELVIGFYAKNSALSGTIENVMVTGPALAPEPSALALAGLGLLSLLCRRSRR